MDDLCTSTNLKPSEVLDRVCVYPDVKSAEIVEKLRNYPNLLKATEMSGEDQEVVEEEASHESKVSLRRQVLTKYHPILIEGPGPSDERDAKVVASIVLYNIRRHFKLKPRANKKPLLLITQGHPIASTGVSAISRIVAKELKIERCLVYLDEDTDPTHRENADDQNTKHEIKLSEIQSMMLNKSRHDFMRIVDGVSSKANKYKSSHLDEQFALLQELTKATLKKVCGAVTIAHTLPEPTKHRITKFHCVGIDLGLIDKESDMVKYSCELFDLLEEKRFDDVLSFFSRSYFEDKLRRANVSHIDGEYGNTCLHLAACVEAPKDIFEKLFEIGGCDLSIATRNKWGSTVLIDACQLKEPNVNTIEFLLKKAKEKLVDDEVVAEFVCMQQKDGCNALHVSCRNARSNPCANEVIKKLIEYGGLELFRGADKYGDTPLGVLYSNQSENIHEIQYISKKWRTADPNLSTVPFTILKSAKKNGYDVSKDVFLQKFMNKIYPTRSFIFVVMFDFYAALTILICLSFGLMNLIKDQPQDKYLFMPYDTYLFVACGLILFSLVWIVTREIVEFCTTPFPEYIINPANYIDTIQAGFGLSTLYIIYFHEGGHLSRLAQNTLMLATGFAWLRIIFIAGELSYQLSVFTSALVQVSNLKCFLEILCLYLCFSVSINFSGLFYALIF